VLKEVLQLEALTPEELKNKLKDSSTKSRFVVLSLCGNQAIVRNFELPILSAAEIKNALCIEALDVFSLHPEEIEVDYQILSSADGKCKGVFAAIPKSALDNYFAQISQAGFIPLVLTAKILTTINSVLRRIPASIKAFYILDFLGEKNVFLALFNEGRCELLRDISYDDLTEAKQEISNSLRYALGKSAAKHPQELYFCGELTGRNELIAGLENEFNFKAKPVESSVSEINAADAYFQLNLFKEHTISLSLRCQLHRVVNIVLVIVILVFMVVFAGASKLDSQIKAFKKNADPAKELLEAKGKISVLESKIKLLENEK